MEAINNLRNESTINVVSKKVVFEGRFVRVVLYSYMKGDSPKIHTYEVVERTNSKKIVAALTITEDEKVVLINQYRIPQGRFCIESPAGLREDDKEPIEKTAKREILEETGYIPEELIYLGSTPTSSGLTTEVIDCYVGINAKKVSDILDLDGAEDIDVLEIPISEMDDFIEGVKNKVGVTIDSKVIFMLSEYRKLKEGNIFGQNN